jgi:hypothetical protein
MHLRVLPLRSLSGLLAVVPALIAGCQDATSPKGADNSLAVCMGPVTVEATTLAEGGRFSWTPRCGLTGLSVPLPPSAGMPGTLWAIESDTHLIAPGVRYGDRPSGTRTTAPAQSLPRGSPFVVWLYGEPGKGTVATHFWRT